jgi:hypothetical protein
MATTCYFSWRPEANFFPALSICLFSKPFRWALGAQPEET